MNETVLSKLEENLSSEFSFRRRTLSDIISESYKSLYECEEGTNLHALAESYIDEVRRNPSDTERLSRRLHILKTLITLEESGKINDSEITLHSLDMDKRAPRKSVRPLKSRLAETRRISRRRPVRESSDAWKKNWDSLSDEEKESSKSYYDSADDKEKDKLANDAKSKYGISADDYKKFMTECDTPKKKKLSDSTRIRRRRVSEARTYKGLDNFKKLSKSKAFYKTFKKLSPALKEGKALTRQDTIDLYKATNSALTHLSVELEHNPKFLPAFRESVSLLSADAASVLGSLKRGKAPSKMTMKSLSNFAGVLLNESAGEKLNDWKQNKRSIGQDYVPGEYKDYGDIYAEIHDDSDEYGPMNIDFSDKNGQIFNTQNKKVNFNNDRKKAKKYADKWVANRSKKGAMNEGKDNRKFIKDAVIDGYESGHPYEDWKEFSALMKEDNLTPTKEDEDYFYSIYDTNPLEEGNMNESEEEDDLEYAEDPEVDIEDDPEDFVGDDEGDIDHVPTEEEEAYDQDYAEGRKKLNDKLADKHGESEDEFVQEKIAQDAAEVAALTGEDEEETDDIDVEATEDDGEESTDSDKSDSPDVAVETEGDDDDITDDELEELKKHLEEMRSMKKKKKSARK